ncbi:MAG: hypothetical protein HOE62_10730 [Alphaproteobacteria bacterium]|jgi:hypothetical protein|nr:hypothetical protein [Alphaproteobacteria bacterium]MBT4018412.1 hypothetical protein [Alphaproteobacteria bacterium]MBT5160299.1 hypothetical protein [Alphaproteobacteria bacterium]MBT5917484.1 hypothetical protein [Alphaproteobacteria bacterium]MBT6387232.1 hypothetical protein [Alphaproteobacteria bacterium]
MPVDYHIDKELLFVDIRASGVLTTAELLQIYEEWLKDADYASAIPVLTDLTDVHTLDVSLEGIIEVFAVAERRSLGRKNAKSAIVVDDRGQVMFARMSAALADQSSNLQTINVFATRDDALVWLSVKQPGALSA